jgi:hypothetical protein
MFEIEIKPIFLSKYVKKIVLNYFFRYFNIIISKIKLKN